jgi:hypothetical protein
MVGMDNFRDSLTLYFNRDPSTPLISHVGYHIFPASHKFLFFVYAHAGTNLHNNHHHNNNNDNRRVGNPLIVNYCVVVDYI